MLLLIVKYALVILAATAVSSLMTSVAFSPSISSSWNLNGVSFVHACAQVLLNLPLMIAYPVPSMQSWSAMATFDMPDFYHGLLVVSHLVFIAYVLLEIYIFHWLDSRLKLDEFAHHVVNLIAVFLSLATCPSYVASVGLFAELSTVFLHLRKFVEGDLRRLAGKCFVVSFYVTRIVLNGYIAVLCALNHFFSVTCLFWMLNLAMNARWGVHIFRKISKELKDH